MSLKCLDVFAGYGDLVDDDTREDSMRVLVHWEDPDQGPLAVAEDGGLPLVFRLNKSGGLDHQVIDEDLGDIVLNLAKGLR